MKELINILFNITEKIDRRTKPWHPLEHWSTGQIFGINLLQVGQPTSMFSFSSGSAMMEVVGISHCHFLRLITNQSNASSHFWSYLAFEASFAQKTVNGLDFVPTCKKYDWLNLNFVLQCLTSSPTNFAKKFQIHVSLEPMCGFDQNQFLLKA